MPKEYLNSLQLRTHSVGNERRLDMLQDILKNGTFLPKTVEYKDIDLAFREWVKSLTIISDEGVEYPTMSLFSNQRFSEYSQSWQYLDENNNLLLNFKTITRENNPQLGKIQGENWNIPGERFYTMRRQKVLDDNGTESFLTLKMRQPVAIDMIYKISIFTTKYEAINEFNTLINKNFAARQCYISPNEHFMPMILDNISDESKYAIDDRQFYSQTYQIKVLAYIITENDYKVEESPLKIGGNFGFSVKKKKAKINVVESIYYDVHTKDECGNIKKNTISIKKADLETFTDITKEIIDSEDIDCETEAENEYYYKSITITSEFPNCVNEANFTSDAYYSITQIKGDETIWKIFLKVNDEDVNTENVSEDKPLILKKGDEVKISIKKKFFKDTPSIVNLQGFDPMKVYPEDLEDDIDDNIEAEIETK